MSVKQKVSVDEDTAAFINKIKMYYEEHLQAIQDMIDAKAKEVTLGQGESQVILKGTEASAFRMGLIVAKSIIGEFPAIAENPSPPTMDKYLPNG